VSTSIPLTEDQPFSEKLLPWGHPIDEPPASNLDPIWRKAHCNTLENLLRIVLKYYHSRYPYPALQTLYMRLFEEDTRMFINQLINPPAGTLANLPDNNVNMEDNYREYSPPALDSRALEQLATDQLVNYFYANPELSQDIQAFGSHARRVSDYWYTPLFESSEARFFFLVCNTFHDHPS
jgi:hypothetical protein